MNEQELRQAMRATMATSTAPPPMNETLVLDAARRAERRRRARWAGAGSAVAAAAVVGLAVVLVAVTSGAGGQDGLRPGTTPTSTTSATSTDSSVSATEQPSDTEQSWPNGQTDRTAQSGPEFDKGETLLARLSEVVPEGLGAPEDLTYEDPNYSGGPLRYSQAQYDDTVDGVEVWEYMAEQPVTKGDGVGRLLAQVTTSGNRITGDGCELPPLWGLEGTCAEETVDGKPVGVFTATPGGRTDFDSWAAYRHDDGTVVYVAQATEYAGSAKPKLAAAPMPLDRLAELAADDRFHLD